MSEEELDSANKLVEEKAGKEVAENSLAAVAATLRASIQTAKTEEAKAGQRARGKKPKVAPAPPVPKVPTGSDPTFEEMQPL
eukprot:3409872-Prorocentrum_lima.AAC.1